jgi:hypothetical protein
MSVQARATHDLEHQRHRVTSIAFTSTTATTAH